MRLALADWEVGCALEKRHLKPGVGLSLTVCHVCNSSLLAPRSGTIAFMASARSLTRYQRGTAKLIGKKYLSSRRTHTVQYVRAELHSFANPCPSLPATATSPAKWK